MFGRDRSGGRHFELTLARRWVRVTFWTPWLVKPQIKIVKSEDQVVGCLAAGRSSLEFSWPR